VDGTGDLFEYVVPVAEHVEGDATALFGTVVPAGSLRGLPVALEHPVAELTSNGKDASEEAAVDKAAQLS
jgi:hypothetical protein